MARILLLDDSPTQTLYMQRQLQRLGHEVCHVGALSEALGLVAAEVRPEADAEIGAEVKSEPIDLALVELTLLQDNGFDVGLSLLRAGVSKVLLLSGARRETDDIWAQALGLQGVLSRPLTAQRLGARIADVLAGVQTRVQPGVQTRGRTDVQ
ncbi:MAG: response regulator [Gammaproteobacteria bacterium]|nr:response regulator [Gammaproteobacteria bacterium]